MVAEYLLKPQSNYDYFTLNTQGKSTHYLFYKKQQTDLTVCDLVVPKNCSFWKVRHAIIVVKT